MKKELQNFLTKIENFFHTTANYLQLKYKTTIKPTSFITISSSFV